MMPTHEEFLFSTRFFGDNVTFGAIKRVYHANSIGDDEDELKRFVSDVIIYVPYYIVAYITCKPNNRLSKNNFKTI